MGVNDTGEQLEAAIAECVNLEHTIAGLSSEITRLEQEPAAKLTLTDDQVLALANHLLRLEQLGEGPAPTGDLRDASSLIYAAADTVINASRARRR